MPESLTARAAHAIELAKAAGAQDAFAKAHRERSVRCELRNGELEKLQENTTRGVELRLYVDGRYSTHRTTDLRDDKLREFVRDAVALTRMLQPDPFRRLPGAELFASASAADLDLVDPSIDALTHDERIGACRRMNERIAGKPRVISAACTAYDNHVHVAAVGSNGFEGAYEATGAGISAFVTLKDEGDSRPEDGYGVGARHRSNLEQPEVIGDRALERAQARLGTKKGPTLACTMVVDRMAAGQLVARLLAPASAEAVQQKRSMWANLLGKRKLSSRLTIVDDPSLPRGLGSRPFDDEGITAARRTVIQRGTLEQFFVDTYYGRKLDMPPTSGSWSNLVVEPGRRDFASLVGDVKRGVYVTSWLGGNADPNTGDFSLGLRGRTIERGKLGGPIGEMNVTGNLLGLFADLRDLGNDPWLYGTIRVPTLVFDDVQFSGA